MQATIQMFLRFLYPESQLQCHCCPFFRHHCVTAVRKRRRAEIKNAALDYCIGNSTLSTILKTLGLDELVDKGGNGRNFPLRPERVLFTICST